MKIVIPVSSSDQHLLEPFLDAVAKQGSIGDHEVIFIPTPSCVEKVQQNKDRLSGLCRNVQVVPCPRDWEGGWPIACNNHWHFAVSWLDGQRNKDVWLWLELDTVPMKQGWIQQLMEKYTIGLGRGEIFMGVMNPLAASGVEDEHGLVMNGVAFYPAMLSTFPNITPLFTMMGRMGGMGIKEPFDKYLRWQFRKLGWNNVKPVISHHWKSKEYERKGDSIVYKKEDVPGEFTLSPDAILVHGCKDGSLHRLVAGTAKEEKKIEFYVPKRIVGEAISGDQITPATTGLLQVEGDVKPVGWELKPNVDDFNPGQGQQAVEIKADGEAVDRHDIAELEEVQPKPEPVPFDESKLNPEELEMYQWLIAGERNVREFKNKFDLGTIRTNELLSLFGHKTKQGGKIVKI